MRNEDERLHTVELAADGSSEGMMRILPTKIIVERENWVYMKGDLVHQKAEILRLECHLGLLNKYNDHL